jgi:hypothetical protein
VRANGAQAGVSDIDGRFIVYVSIVATSSICVALDASFSHAEQAARQGVI